MLKKILPGLLGVIFLLGAGGYLYYRFVLFVPPLISDHDRALLKIMPLPAELRLKSGAFEVTKDFGIQFTDRLVRAADRFKTRLSKSTGINSIFCTHLIGASGWCLNLMCRAIPKVG